jgi:sugar phosphate isomerase/epimerase
MWGKPTRIPRVTPEQEKIIYDTFESKGLSCVALSPGTFMKPYSKEQYAEDMAILDKTFSMAKRLKTRLLVVFSFGRNGAPASAAMPAEQVEALREAARRAADQGIVLAVENMQGQWADTAENTRKVLEAVAHPAYRLNWDAGNAVAAGGMDAYPQGYRMLKQYMVHFHLKNILKTADGIAWSVLPKGIIDWDAHLREVVADGYKGFFLIETHHEPFESNSKTNLDYLRRTLTQIAEKGHASARPVETSGASRV